MTLPDSDLFIINRRGTNYRVDFDNVKQYIPGMPAGSRCVFYMEAAPFGWTTDDGAQFSEATVRVVSGNGGGSGGSVDFSDVFKSQSTAVPTHNHTVSAGNHKHSGSISHGHSVRDPSHGHGAGGKGQKHNHSNNGPDGVGGSDYGPGAGVMLQGWSWRLDEQVVSAASDGGGAGGNPTAGKTGCSVNNASATVSFTSGKATNLRTTNTTGNVGNSIDFTVKYHKGIVCQKDVY